MCLEVPVWRLESTAPPVQSFFEKQLQQIRRNSVVTVNLCKKIHPASWNVKKMKWNTSLLLSESSVRASDTAGAAVDECCVLTIPTNHTEVWLLPSTDVFHFHLLSTNLAYTAHLSTHSPPHILYREISIVSSYSCLLYFLSDWKALCEVCWLLESADLTLVTITGSCLASVWTCLQCISSRCVFPLYTVYSHTVICICGILEK